MKRICRSFFRLTSLIGVVLAAFLLAKNWRDKSSSTFEPEGISGLEAKPEKMAPASKKYSLTPRQNVIYAIIRGKKSLEMKDLLPKIPGVTERTLRRDLLKLQEAGLIMKQGTTKASSYVLIK